MTANRFVTRTPFGTNDSQEVGPLGDYAGYRPFRYHDYWNDFDDLVAGDFTVTKSAGSAAPVIIAGDGGLLKLNNAGAGATDFSYMQWAGGSGASIGTWAWNASFDMFLQFTFNVDDATNSSVFLGLEQVTATPFTFLDSIGFYKASGATALVAQFKSGATVVTIPCTNLGAVVAATQYDCVLAYTAVDGIWRAWVNANYQGSLTAAQSAGTSTNNLTSTIALLNASAAAHTLIVDYFFVSKVRQSPFTNNQTIG